MSTKNDTWTQRHTQHASWTRGATYFFAFEFHFLACFKVEEFAYAKCKSEALVQTVAILETLRDLPLHSLAHAFVIALIPTRQTNNHNNNPPKLTTSTIVTLLLLSRPSAIKRPPTSVKALSLCITRRHMRCQPQHQITFTSALQACTLHISPPLPSHAPAYQEDRLKALEPAQACAQRLNVVILQLVQRVA